jgi:hypothetical protein
VGPFSIVDGKLIVEPFLYLANGLEPGSATLDAEVICISPTFALFRYGSRSKRNLPTGGVNRAVVAGARGCVLDAPTLADVEGVDGVVLLSGSTTMTASWSREFYRM